MPNEYINYEQVRNGAKQIIECAMKMQQIFDDVSGNVTNMTSSDTWSGTSSNTLQEEFMQFKNQFPGYINAVKRFAALFEAATTVLEENEMKLNSQIEQL